MQAGNGAAAAAAAPAPPAAPAALTLNALVQHVRTFNQQNEAKLQKANEALTKMEQDKNNHLLLKEMELAQMRGSLSEAKTAVLQYRKTAEQTVICLLVLLCVLYVR